MSDNPIRSVAQFFFEVGYGAAYAEALIRNNMAPPFELTDELIERAWEIAGEAHEDHAEFDRYLALANASTPLNLPPNTMEQPNACHHHK